MGEKSSKLILKDEYVELCQKTGISVTTNPLMFHLPSSAFRNDEVKPFIEWLKVHNITEIPFMYISVSYKIPEKLKDIFFEKIEEE